MQRLMRSLTAVVILAALASTALGQDSSQEDFAAFGRDMTGRFVGDVKLVTDWPGEGKQGDKITGYAELRPVVDGSALSLTYYGGSGSGVALIMYDAGAKKIRWIGASSGGTYWNRVVYKSGDDWISEVSGSLPDGKQLQGKLKLTISDEGNTHTWTGQLITGDEKADPLHDVWRRVSK